ncbi:MAG: class I adenylate-forming enzyme family protein [Parvibaculaceae bacterium]|nr:class I adenylate-forming enzyme family protein [Parvibaculaceae bacterium]
MTEQNATAVSRGPIEGLQYYAEAKAHQLFVIDSVSNTGYTWAEVYGLVCRMDHYLQSAGCTSKDRLAISCADEIVTLIAGLACLKAGIPFFLLPFYLSPTQKANTLAQMGAHYLFTDHEIETPPGTQLLGLSRGALSAYTYGVQNNPAIDEEAIGFFVLGSGTTGASKLMPFSHRIIRQRADWANAHTDISEHTRYSVTVHLTFSSPFFRSLYALAGGYSIVLGLLDVRRFPQAVAQYQVTHMLSTVLQMEQLVSTFDNTKKAAFLSLEQLSVSFSTVHPDLLTAIKRCITPYACNSYGCNETGGAARLDGEAYIALPGSVGKPYEEGSVEVVDKMDCPVSANARGSIRIKTPCMLEGYADPDLPDNANFRDGWFYTGDVGYFSDDGQLIHLGRGDHLMIFNGINIYPAEIEQTLLTHPAVKDVAVVPIKHKLHQEVPGCVVSLVAGAQMSEMALKRFAADLLGAKAPALLTIAESVPRNPQGKIIRSEIVRLIASGVVQDQAVRAQA